MNFPMLQPILALMLTVAAIVGAFMLPRATGADALNNRMAFGGLAVAASFTIALLAPEPVGLFYKAAVTLGLVLVLAATLLLVSRFLPAYAGHAHLLWAYLLYFVGFASLTRFPIPSLAVLLLLAGWAIAYFQFSPYVREQWGAVVAYAVILGLATWQALELVVAQPTAYWSWAALAGMLVLVGTHTVQAVDQFRRPLKAAPWTVVSFLLGQCIIAWSVWGYVQL
jgi:hypothetical protein